MGATKKRVEMPDGFKSTLVRDIDNFPIGHFQFESRMSHPEAVEIGRWTDPEMFAKDPRYMLGAAPGRTGEAGDPFGKSRGISHTTASLSEPAGHFPRQSLPGNRL